MTKLRCRRNTNRIPQHDYSQPGYYFVTICSQDRLETFGVVENNQMVLNDVGKMVNFWWQEMFRKYDNICKNEYIIMPNHIHGIIHIVGARFPRPRIRFPHPDNNINDEITGRGNRAPTIGNIIAYFKYQSTKQINEMQDMSGRKTWQRNYYDHIIRNDKSLCLIRQYIQTNPLTWEDDRENPDKCKK